MGTKDYLVQEGYFLESGEVSPEYIFESEDIDYKKDICIVTSMDTKVKKILNYGVYRKMKEDIFEFIEGIQRYYRLQPSFETGDFLRHVGIIKAKQKCKKILEELATEIL